MQLKQKNNEYRSDGTASFYDLIDGQWVEEETTYNEYFAPESWEHPLNPKSSDLYVASYFFCPQSSEKMALAYMSVVNRQIINTLTYVGLPFKPTLSLHKK